MIYVLIQNGEVAAVSSDYPKDGTGFFVRGQRDGWQNRNDWRSFEEAELIADQVTRFTGKRFIPIDCGPNVYPQFDVIECPTIGDDTSYTFNGDYYPCGKITSISKSLKLIRTSDGKAFYRRKRTGAWLYRGTWALVPGTIRRWNPEF